MGQNRLSATQFHDGGLLYVIAVNVKQNEGAHLVPALLAGCSRIDVQAVQCIVVHDLKDVRMTTDEQTSLFLLQSFFQPRGITARIARNVLHQYGYCFAPEYEGFREQRPNSPVVDIAKNTPKGLVQCLQLGYNIQGAKVARVPYFIAGTQVRQDGFIQVAMGV